MKFGLRIPSLPKSIAARTSIKKKIMPKMPKGLGVLRDPEKALYNKVYNKTSMSVGNLGNKSIGKEEKLKRR